jgi:hypothetical protein
MLKLPSKLNSHLFTDLSVYLFFDFRLAAYHQPFGYVLNRRERVQVVD